MAILKYNFINRKKLKLILEALSEKNVYSRTHLKTRLYTGLTCANNKRNR